MPEEPELCPDCGEELHIRQCEPSPANYGFDGSVARCIECGYEDVR